MNKTKKIILRMCFSAIFGALCFICTNFLKIPFPNGMGYFNFGDMIIVFSSIYLGPIEGIFVGLIGGVFSDLYSGYINFIPFTIIAKTLLALCGGLAFYFIKNCWIKFLFPFLGALLMVTTYFISYWIFFGFAETYLSLFDLLQGFIGASLGVVLFLFMKKIKFTPFLNNK